MPVGSGYGEVKHGFHCIITLASSTRWDRLEFLEIQPGKGRATQPAALLVAHIPVLFWSGGRVSFL